MGLTEWIEAERKKEVFAVGDLHGNMEAYDGNLKSLGAIDEHGEWTAGDRILIILGDILADRGTDGLAILKKICILRQQARTAGGDVKVLAGNHDDFAISYLAGKPIPNGDDPVEKCEQNWQGKGLLEFRRFGSPQLQSVSESNLTFSWPLWQAMSREQKKIAERMRSDPEGREILEEICKMQLAERIDDSLFVHTNPTAEMMGRIVRDGIDVLNARFEAALRDSLLRGKPASRDLCWLSALFLNTGNRETFHSDLVVRELEEAGIRHVFHGHTNMFYDSTKRGDILIVPLDRRALKPGRPDMRDERSIAVIKRDGEIRVGPKLHAIHKSQGLVRSLVLKAVGSVL